MSSAFKGKQNEERSVTYLEDQGYYCFKSANSYGKFDVIGIYIGDDTTKPFLMLVQCKTNMKFISGLVSDLKVIADLLRKSNRDFSIEIHNWLPYAREPEITKV